MSSDEVPDPNAGSYFVNWARDRIQDNRSISILIIGNVRSGKSVAGLDIGLILDTDRFDVNSVHFSPKDYVHHVNVTPDNQRGVGIMLDDAGLAIDARLWQNMSNVLFGQMIQGYAWKQFVSIVTTPRNSFIDVRARQMFDIVFEATDVRGLFKMKLAAQPAINFKNQYPYYIYPKRQYDDLVVQTKTIQFPMAPAWLHDEYLRKKTDTMNERFQNFEEWMKKTGYVDSDRNGGKGGGGVELTCDNCGYKWDYSGKNRSPQCPQCGHRVKVPEASPGKTHERENEVDEDTKNERAET